MSSGAVVWFTGLPASGKSTIARLVAETLRQAGVAVELLDAAEVRQSLSRGLGFSRQDREEHVRRMGYVAMLLSRNGVVTLCTAVSPYRATRAELRARISRFVEVFVDCPPAEAERRDTKGLYERARAGTIEEFTGVSAPYEPPERPEVHVRTDRENAREAAATVVTTLQLLAIVDASRVDGLALTPAESEIRERLAGLGYA